MFLFLGTIENLSDTTFGNWSYDYFCGINRLIFLRENSGDHKISGEFRSPVNIFTHWKYFVNTHFFYKNHVFFREAQRFLENLKFEPQIILK